MSLLIRNLDLFDPLDAEAGVQETAAAQLEVVAGYIRRCLLCDLGRNRRNAVPGEGDPRARLMIVGEGPGENEDLQGRPFVGRAGELLDKILEAAGISRPDVFITNIVKCRAADMVEGKPQNRAPKASEVDACRPYLVRQVEMIQPAAILCLGAPAARACIDRDFDLSGQRGEWFEGPFGSRMMATFHPAFILRRGGAGAGARDLKKMVSDDMQKLGDYLDGGG